MYYDKDGTPLELMEWANKMEDGDYRIVKQENVNGFMVSTVWLGIDYNVLGDIPVIFETMVFQDTEPTEYEEHKFDEIQERYATERSALAGHKRMVKEVRRETK